MRSHAMVQALGIAARCSHANHVVFQVTMVELHVAVHLKDVRHAECSGFLLIESVVCTVARLAA
jgi:hypothetical protein